MALTEQTSIEQITVSGNGIVGSLRVTRVSRDGVEIATSNHRETYTPGQDLTGVDAKIVAIANTAWTPEVVAAYQAEQAALYAARQTEIAANADGEQA